MGGQQQRPSSRSPPSWFRPWWPTPRENKLEARSFWPILRPFFWRKKGEATTKKNRLWALCIFFFFNGQWMLQIVQHVLGCVWVCLASPDFEETNVRRVDWSLKNRRSHQPKCIKQPCGCRLLHRWRGVKLFQVLDLPISRSYLTFVRICDHLCYLS